MKEQWWDKYHPKTVDEYVFRDKEQERQIRQWITDKSIPHLMLSGPPGVGKTALAKMLISELNIHDFDLLELDASDKNSVDTMREKVINFVPTIPFGTMKIVLLDEADHISLSGQSVLRGAMTSNNDVTRFILTCNYPNKIMPAIHSRCQGFHINKLDLTDFTAKVAEILIAEGVDFELELLDTYVKSAYPDMRNCIGLLEQNSSGGVLRMPAEDDEEDAKDYRFEMVELFKDRKIREARNLICAKIRVNEIEEMFTWMYNNLEMWSDTDEGKDKAIVVIRNGLVSHTLVADPEINLSATFVELSQIGE